MNEKSRLTIRVFKLLDLAFVVISFVLALVLIAKSEHGMSIARFLSLRTRVADFGLFILALFSCHLIFQLSGLYSSRGFSKTSSEMLLVLKAVTLTTAYFTGLSWLFSIKMISLEFLLLFWLLLALLLAAVRFAVRVITEHLFAPHNDYRCMLILGTNSRATDFARRILENPEQGYRLLGFVDEDWPGITNLKRNGFRVVTNFAGLAEFLRQNVVDEVVNFLPVCSFYKHSCEIAELCEQHGITVRFNSDIFALKTARWRAEEFDGGQYIASYTGSSEVSAAGHQAHH